MSKLISPFLICTIMSSKIDSEVFIYSKTALDFIMPKQSGHNTTIQKGRKAGRYSARFFGEVRMERIYIVTPEAVKNMMILITVMLIINRTEHVMLTHRVVMAITFALRGMPLPLLKSLM